MIFAVPRSKAAPDNGTSLIEAIAIMSVWSLALLITSVSLSAVAQLLMKAGMMNDAIQRSIASRDGILNIVIAVMSSPLVLCGLASFGVSVTAWLYVLSKIHVSQAYPAMALGIAVTALAGFFLFGEPINGMQLVGIAIIVIGVALVAAS